MSDAEKGRNREHIIRRKLEELGYIAQRSPGSKGIDLYAEWPDPSSGVPRLVIEVGGVSKRVRRAFADLRARRQVIGSRHLLAIIKNRKWTFWTDEDTKFSDLSMALEHLRKAA